MTAGGSKARAITNESVTEYHDCCWLLLICVEHFQADIRKLLLEVTSFHSVCSLPLRRPLALRNVIPFALLLEVKTCLSR